MIRASGAVLAGVVSGLVASVGVSALSGPVAAETVEDPTHYVNSDPEAACDGTVPEGGLASSMTRYQVLCLRLADGLTILDPADDRVASGPFAPGPFTAEQQSDGWWRASVPASFDWNADTLPRTPATFVTLDTTTDQEAPFSVDVDLVPEITILTDVARAPDSTDDPTSPDAAGGDTAESDAAGTEPAEGALPVVSTTPVVKTIWLTGRDRDIDGLEIREQARVGQLKLRVNGEVEKPEDGADSIALALPDDDRVSYELSLADGANFGRDTIAQRTDLVLGDVVITTTPTDLELDAPLVEIDVQAPATVDREEIIVSVRVTNKREAAVDGPLQIVLKPSEGGDLVRGLAEPTDADASEIDGNTVTWTIDGIPGEQGQIVQSIEVDLNRSTTPAQILWTGELRRDGADTPIESDSATTDIGAAAGDEEGAGVDFTPDQMVRLIAFVMAFALVAVVFGAWSRRTGSSSEPRSEEGHRHEVELFRAYTETILVLVILVAILVLALQESLSGESAASLIGVIAGYALGRSMGGAQ